MALESARTRQSRRRWPGVLSRVVWSRRHAVVVAGLAVFMAWIRLRAVGQFVSSHDVLFSGNDAWYHLREVQYVVRRWPATMPFDPWTNFPHGTAGGAFGTVFDQIVATVALVVGLGDPSNRTVALVLLVTPALAGTLAVVPTYLLAARLRGRLAGVVAAAVLAFLPGIFLQRTLVGAADHNAAEPLFQTVAVLAMMVALAAADREDVVYEHVLDRDWRGLRNPLGAAVLAGVATAAYQWVWPPGMLIVGLFGVVFVATIVHRFVAGRTPESVAIVGATAMAVTSVLMLVPLQSMSPRPARFTSLQPAAAAGVAIACVGLGWLARRWNRTRLPRRAYPVVVGAAGVAGLLVARAVIPGVVALVATNVERVLLVGQGAATRTIGEAQPVPLGEASAFLGQQYGLAAGIAWIGAALVGVRWLVGDDRPAEEVVAVAWFALLTAAGLTQVRFNYYLAVAVSVFAGVAVGEVAHLLGAAGRPWHGVTGPQALGVGVAVLVVVAPLAPPLASPSVLQASAPARTGPGAVTAWDSALEWLATETPPEGAFAAAGNRSASDGDRLAYHGTYRVTDDYEYPRGAYGVLSWWDYGHWITVRGERIPVANPFQHGATPAANVLLAPNETAADRRLAALRDGPARTRYIVVDWKMVDARSKLGAPTVFYDRGTVSPTDLYAPVYRTRPRVEPALYRYRQRYYRSLMVRLYRFHGSAAPASEFVLDVERRRFRTDSGATVELPTLPTGAGSPVRRLPNHSVARRWAAADGSALVGGFGPYPPRRVEALQHYRLVAASERGLPDRVEGTYRPPHAWVKVFERVPGACVVGVGPPNATVTASVRLHVPARNATFTYRQRARADAAGRFRFRLPYSTTGVDRWGPDRGRTNASVRSTGPYRFVATTRSDNGSADVETTVSVPEAAVIGVDDDPIRVRLDEAAAAGPATATAAPAPASPTATNATAGGSATTCGGANP